LSDIVSRLFAILKSFLWPSHPILPVFSKMQNH
jgi:hypothetical protein